MAVRKCRPDGVSQGKGELHALFKGEVLKGNGGVLDCAFRVPGQARTCVRARPLTCVSCKFTVFAWAEMGEGMYRIATEIGTPRVSGALRRRRVLSPTRLTHGFGAQGGVVKRAAGSCGLIWGRSFWH